MGCQSEVFIGDDLTFSVTTHDPDTGVLTDADSAPAYRIYEDETATAILTGAMAKLDNASTTGFYTELIACTAANGFEAGKSYTVYIEATVDGDTGGICYGFRATTAIWSYAERTLTTSAVGVVTPTGGNISIVRGDSWSADITSLGDISTRTKLWFTVKHQRSDLDSASTIQIEETAGLIYLNSADASARAANGSITVTDEVAGDVTIALDEVETALLQQRAGLPYDIQMLDAAGDVTTLALAGATITDDVTRAVA